MDVCLFGISAYDVLRRSDELAPELLSLPRTTRLSGCGISCSDAVREELRGLGLPPRAGEPVHAMVSSDAHPCEARGIVRHVWSGPLPPRLLVRIAPHVLLPTPELCFAQLARMLSTTPFPSALAREVALALAGYELTGTYRSAEGPGEAVDGDDRTIPEPLTTCRSIAQVLETLGGMRGVKLARQALGEVQDGSRSRGETSMALMLNGSRRIGGMAFPRGVLNGRLVTSTGPRYIDQFYLEFGLGIEYKGRRYHPEGLASDDDRRENKLASSGITVLNVWHEDLARPQLFRELVDDIARVMGVRVRIRDEEFWHRQNLLRSLVLPPVHRYDDLGV